MLLRVWKPLPSRMRFKNLEGKPERESPKRTTSANGRLRSTFNAFERLRPMIRSRRLFSCRNIRNHFELSVLVHNQNKSPFIKMFTAMSNLPKLLLSSGISQSYTTQREKKLTGYASNNQRFDSNTESSTMVANQGAITQLSEQISSLNDRMDEFTTRIEELNSKLSFKTNSPSHHNLNLQAETCNGSVPTSCFVSGLGNGSLTGSIIPNSSSFSQLAKDSPLMDEISGIVRGQRQVMHQLDCLSNLLRERDSAGERSRQVRTKKKTIIPDPEPLRLPLLLTVAVGGVGIFLYKSLSRN